MLNRLIFRRILPFYRNRAGYALKISTLPIFASGLQLWLRFIRLSPKKLQTVGQCRKSAVTPSNDAKSCLNIKSILLTLKHKNGFSSFYRTTGPVDDPIDSMVC